MTDVVSISLDAASAREAALVERAFGFRNRSELFRTALRSLASERAELDSLEGRIHAVAVVEHPKKGEEELAGIKHAFEDVISTQIHHNTAHGCLEVFILDGAAARIRAFAKHVKAARQIRFSRVVPA